MDQTGQFRVDLLFATLILLIIVTASILTYNYAANNSMGQNHDLIIQEQITPPTSQWP